MSKADEMFKELGYAKIYDSNSKIIYKKSGTYFDKEISFDFFDNTIYSELSDGKSAKIDKKELQAINEKCKELGWLQ